MNNSSGTEQRGPSLARVHMVSLGCPKNLVDSEVMLGILARRGMETVEDPAEADLLLVNTCGFIQSAVEEGIDEILALAWIKKEARSRGRQVVLAVCGCMVQRYGRDLAGELPEVDLFLGPDACTRIGELLDRALEAPGLVVDPPPRWVMDGTTPRMVSTPPHRAYLKITEGCSNRCTYCLIPALRGPLRSRDTADLAAEARALDQGGVKELTLVGQDLCAFGRDTGQSLPGLLRTLLRETAIPWLRLLYLYPDGIGPDLLDLVAAQSRILPYFDIPIQHISPRVLRRMGRRYGPEEVHRLLERIRLTLPGAALRTTLMVGFPGEDEKDMALLEDLVRQVRFDHLGVFAYQNEEGCAASRLDGHVPEEVKKERAARIMALQEEISRERLRAFVGQRLEVLVEGPSPETGLLLEGRTRFQAPDIDGRVYIRDGMAPAGTLARVHISESHAYDLVGEIVAPRDSQSGQGHPGAGPRVVTKAAARGRGGRAGS